MLERSPSPLELKVPPVAVGVSIGTLMWLAAKLGPGLTFVTPWRLAVWIALASVGTAVAVAGVISFRRVGTTVNPTKPGSTSALVVAGIYRLTRNPIYLGFLIALAGWAAYLSNPLSILLVPAFVLYMNRYQISPEERALEALFGNEFLEYKARVRRWL